MEQKEKDIRKKEAYEKPEVKSEDLEIWVYGYSGDGPPPGGPGLCGEVPEAG